jgi:hypothetical protein
MDHEGLHRLLPNTFANFCRGGESAEVLHRAGASMKNLGERRADRSKALR